MQYQEIKALQTFVQQHTLEFKYKVKVDEIGASCFAISWDNLRFSIWVFDDYQDLERNNPLLTWTLIMLALECLEESTDYLDWCKTEELNANHEIARQYYQDMVSLLPKLRPYFKDEVVCSFVSAFDLELNAGAAQYLRQQ